MICRMGSDVCSAWLEFGTTLPRDPSLSCSGLLRSVLLSLLREVYSVPHAGMDITNVVTALVDVAKQLHAARLAAEECSSDAESLFECVCDNTLIIQAVVEEGLHVSSSNPVLATALHDAISNVVKTLSTARDAYYKYLLTGK